jgi:hypothetical protein
MTRRGAVAAAALGLRLFFPYGASAFLAPPAGPSLWRRDSGVLRASDPDDEDVRFLSGKHIETGFLKAERVR